MIESFVEFSSIAIVLPVDCIETVIFRPDLSTSSAELWVDSDFSLSKAALQVSQQWFFLKLLNTIDRDVINVMFLQTSFSVTWRVLRLSADWANLSSLNKLELWVSSVGVKLESLISTAENQLKVLQLLYWYKHLDGQNLFNLLSTDLILHWVCLILRTKPYNAHSQKRWPPHTE